MKRGHWALDWWYSPFVHIHGHSCFWNEVLALWSISTTLRRTAFTFWNWTRGRMVDRTVWTWHLCTWKQLANHLFHVVCWMIFHVPCPRVAYYTSNSQKKCWWVAQPPDLSLLKACRLQVEHPVTEAITGVTLGGSGEWHRLRSRIDP